MASFSLANAIRKAVSCEALLPEEAESVAQQIMDGEATSAQISALLVALRMKGETVEEATAFARAMRSRVVRVHAHRAPLLDTCGTGGGAFRVFNVSTTSAFLLAATGIAIAKHGNRAMSGVCGSADVLEALGVRIELTPEQCAACIDTLGIGFLFAQKHHPAMRHVAAPRREIGVRTLFNLLGPMTNPAGATHQVLGVYSADLCPLVAQTLGALGCERALVLHSDAGMTEISTIGATRYCELRDGEISEGVLTPKDFGIETPEPSPLHLAPAATAQENADLVREVLQGEKETPAALARRDLVAVNAAAALYLMGSAPNWREGYHLALGAIDSGEALAVLDRLCELTQAFSA